MTLRQPKDYQPNRAMSEHIIHIPESAIACCSAQSDRLINIQ
ncbi:MAG: hypothetical protein V7K48_17250 [Nostoc sp.]